MPAVTAAMAWERSVWSSPAIAAATAARTPRVATVVIAPMTTLRTRTAAIRVERNGELVTGSKGTAQNTAHTAVHTRKHSQEGCSSIRSRRRINAAEGLSTIRVHMSRLSDPAIVTGWVEERLHTTPGRNLNRFLKP